MLRPLLDAPSFDAVMPQASYILACSDHSFEDLAGSRTGGQGQGQGHPRMELCLPRKCSSSPCRCRR